MALILHQHPLASFCHKVLIALYENDTPFESRIVNLGDPQSREAFYAMAPTGKMPVLRDEARNATIAETTIIIEYLQRFYPGSASLLPEDVETALKIRLWDRVFDCYVQQPMQAIVAERMRPDDAKDPYGVDEARKNLAAAYRIVEKQLGDQEWITGENFSMADCAAAPALFYAETLVPFGSEYSKLKAYHARLMQRPSFARVLDEAKPYFQYYPYRERLPASLYSAD